jgi:phosphatidate phosphatase
LEARVKIERFRFIKAGVQLIAFIGSWHTCMSRISDYKHHYTDVVAGATIGISVAVFSVSLKISQD